MRITVISANATQIEIGLEIGHATVLFSYETPVAAHVPGLGWMTTKAQSRTTAKHINQWLRGADAELVPVEFLRALMQTATISVAEAMERVGPQHYAQLSEELKIAIDEAIEREGG